MVGTMSPSLEMTMRRRLVKWIITCGLTLFAIPIGPCAGMLVDGAVRSIKFEDVFNFQNPNYFNPNMIFRGGTVDLEDQK